jgi:hypothetical protein
VTILAGVLLLISVVCATKRKRWAWKIAVAGAILALIAIFFYMTGVYALIELTGYIDWFEWDMVGMSVAFTGAGLAIASAVMMFIMRPPPAKKKAVAKKKKVKRPKKKVKADAEKPNGVPSDGLGDPGQLPDDQEDGGGWMPSDDE